MVFLICPRCREEFSVYKKKDHRCLLEDGSTRVGDKEKK